MSSTLERIYKVKDVDMLITASTVIENAIANKTFLQSKRSTWADPFFDNQKASIDSVIKNSLGIDGAKELRQSTTVVKEIQKDALVALAEVKIQIIEDFKKTPARRDEILKQLGFTSYHPQAQSGDQEGLINLLFQFQTSLPAIKKEIVEKGTMPATLDNITGFADTLKASNVTQETFKGTRKVVTAATVAEFNAIYEAVISICKISAKFYKSDPAIKDQFAFTKIAKALNAKK